MRLLLVEDNDQARDALAEILRDERYEVSTACGGQEALGMAEREPPDLILSDVCMPKGDGLQLVADVRRSHWGRGVPILLMSARHQTSHRVAGLNRGADDFIPKPLDLEELLARIRTQARRAQWEAELLRSSLHDPLTGLLNRRGLAESYSHELARNSRMEELPVALVDLNGFKAINDRYGHAAGDQALREVAAVLRASVRPTDWVGRIGGDEFLVVLSRASAEDARGLARRLRLLSPVPVRVSDDVELEVSFAVGTASGGADEPLDKVMVRADRAMYGHKASLRPAERAHGRVDS